MSAYVHTSAAAKLLLDETESGALGEYLDGLADVPISSALLETELRRIAIRLGLAQRSVTEILDRIDLVDASRSLVTESGLLPGPHLRSLDAVHLATALRAEVTAVVAYDRRLLEHAAALGLVTVSPGRAE